MQKVDAEYVVELSKSHMLFAWGPRTEMIFFARTLIFDLQNPRLARYMFDTGDGHTAANETAFYYKQLCKVPEVVIQAVLVDKIVFVVLKALLGVVKSQPSWSARQSTEWFTGWFETQLSQGSKGRSSWSVLVVRNIFEDVGPGMFFHLGGIGKVGKNKAKTKKQS